MVHASLLEENMIKLSIVFGILGIFVSGALRPRLSRWTSHQRPQHYWVLGSAALFPAWLIAFIGLLPSPAGQPSDAPLPPSAILASGAALFGIILTHYALRRLHISGHVCRAMTYWLLGVATLLPAWCIALLANIRK